jgi:hypothetical protein
LLRYLQLRFYGKLQKQGEDMQFYLAIRHVSALGMRLPRLALPALQSLLRSNSNSSGFAGLGLSSGGCLRLNPGGQLPGSCCCMVQQLQQQEQQWQRVTGREELRVHHQQRQSQWQGASVGSYGKEQQQQQLHCKSWLRFPRFLPSRADCSQNKSCDGSAAAGSSVGELRRLPDGHHRTPKWLLPEQQQQYHHHHHHNTLSSFLDDIAMSDDSSSKDDSPSLQAAEAAAAAAAPAGDAANLPAGAAADLELLLWQAVNG